MKKIVAILLASTLLTSGLIGCGKKTSSNLPEESIPQEELSTTESSSEEYSITIEDDRDYQQHDPDEKESPTTSSVDTRPIGVLIKESDIPTTADHLKSYNRYFITKMPYTFWFANFSPSDMSNIINRSTLPLDFESFYEYLHGSTYREDHGTNINGEKPIHYIPEVYEETIGAFFNLTPAQLQQNQEVYSLEEHRYRPNEGMGSPLIYQQVIDKVEENPDDPTIKVYYTFYVTNELDPNELNTYAEFEGCATIQPEGNNGFKYLANEVHMLETP